MVISVNNNFGCSSVSELVNLESDRRKSVLHCADVKVYSETLLCWANPILYSGLLCPGLTMFVVSFPNVQESSMIRNQE